MLTEQQIEFFDANGYLVVENAVSAEQLDALRADFGGWVEESRQHQDGWCETVNGKSRFDVEKGHNTEKPALLRINAPHEVSAPIRMSAGIAEWRLSRARARRPC